MKIVVLLLFTSLFASRINGQCDLHNEIDKNTGVETVSTNNDLVGTADRGGQLRFKLSLSVGKDTTLRLYITINRFTERNFDPDSKILINCGEEVFTFKISGDPHYGVRLDNFVALPVDTFKNLARYTISSVRVYYLKEYDDFKIIGIYPDYFKMKLKCLANKYPHYIN